MGITIHIYYTGNNGNARKFAQEMESSGTANLIRAEAGNIQYEYFAPIEDAQTILLIDSWETQAAIDAHHATPMMHTIINLRNKYDLHMKVQRYIVDETYTAQQDEKFVRA